MIRFFLPVVFILSLSVAGGHPAGADEAEEQASDTAVEAMDAARLALQEQEYDVAYELFYALAAQDNAIAQYEIGALYHRGAGMEQNAERAARWYARSAELGYVEAQYRIGNMYMMGEGVPQSDSEAIHWYEQAAQQGHQDAGRNLASLQHISAAKTRKELEREAASLPPLEKPKRPVNGDKAEKRGFFGRWFGGDETEKPAAESPAQSPKTAQTPVAAPDKPKKKGFFGRLFNKDKEQQDDASDAQQTPELKHDNVEKAEQNDARRPAPAPLPNSGAVSNYELGMAYALGNTLEQDHAKAFEHFTGSAQEGYAPAQYRLGVAYTNGDGTGKDPAQAIKWYEKSAEQGYASAQRSLALIYLDGLEDIAPNQALALAWYNVLAEDGNQMDAHRRATLLQQLSAKEISQAQTLTEEIQARIRGE